MPIQLIAPRPGKTPYYAGRGKHLGVYVDKSTRTRSRTLARAIIRQWQRDIERGCFAAPGDQTFAGAAVNYMQAGGERRPLIALLHRFGDKPLNLFDQALIDETAAAMLPNATAATRNREIYTPISAVLKRAGFDFRIKRPIGWRGKIVRRWLWPEQAWRVINAAYDVDAELGLLCVMLLFGGLRISEQLAMRCDDVRLAEAFAFVPDSKNGEPQPMHLTPFMVAALAAHPRGLERPGQRLFRFHKGGAVAFRLIQACAMACGLPKPKRDDKGRWPKLPAYEFDFVSWHTFRRSYATWMRRYGSLDDKDLVDTGRWKTIESASRYAQTVVHEAARAADLLPVPPKQRRV